MEVAGVRRRITITPTKCRDLQNLWLQYVNKEICIEELFTQTDQICNESVAHARIKFRTNNPIVNLKVIRPMNKLWNEFVDTWEMETNPKLFKANSLLKRIYTLWGFYLIYFGQYLFCCYMELIYRKQIFHIINRLLWAVCLLTIFRQFINWIRYNNLFRDENSNSFLSFLFDEDIDDYEDY